MSLIASVRGRALSKGPRHEPFRPTKKGFLSKRGHVAKNWKRRWFVLDKSALYYFKNEIADDDLRTQPAGVLDLNLGFVDPVPHDERQFVLCVTIQGRQWFIAADSKTGREEWVRALRMAGAGGGSSSDGGVTNWLDTPVMEGWLTKQGHKVKNWKKRYFVLHGKQLAYFKMKPTYGTEPAGVIDLQSSGVEEEILDDKDRIFCFRIDTAAGVEYHISCATSKERYEWMTYIRSVISS